MHLNHCIQGTIISVEGNQLRVAIPDGRNGIVPFGEVSRSPIKRPEITMNKMLNHSFMFSVIETMPDGTLILSLKRYEEAMYDQIVSDFHEKKRNVYQGELVSCTDYFLFYRLAQGVIGAIHLTDFSYSRLTTFTQLNLPKRLPVCIKSITKEGKIQLSSKPAFGTFDSTVSQFNILPGKRMPGIVTGHFHADSLVSIAPNLTTLIEKKALPLGQPVEVECVAINHQRRKLKTSFVQTLAPGSVVWNYDSFIHPIDVDYLNVELFQQEMGPTKVLTQTPVISPMDSVPASAPPHPTPSAIPPEQAEDARSPFSTFPNETLLYDRSRKNFSPQNIAFELQNGYLGEDHLAVTNAVDALKYSTSRLLSEYLEYHGVIIPQNKINKILIRLIKLGIVGELRFKSDVGVSLSRIVYPGSLFNSYTGRYPKSFKPYDYTQTDAAVVKAQLSANQLLLSVLKWKDSHSLTAKYAVRPLYRDDNTGFRPRGAVELPDELIFVESVRKDQHENFLFKLNRYNTYITGNQLTSKSAVIITLEDENEALAFKYKAEELKLETTVYLTWDWATLDSPPRLLPLDSTAKTNRSFLDKFVALFR